MRDEIDDMEAEAGAPSWFSRVKGAVSTGVGAVLALAILMGLGVWFYGLGTRDVADVPIIRAAAEPAKVRPADPGGMVTPHQQIASYEAAKVQPASVNAAVLAPAIPAPRAEDVAMSRLAVERPVPASRPAPEEPVLREETAEVAREPAAPEPQQIAAINPETVTDEAPVAEQSAPAPRPAPGGTANAPRLSPVAPSRPRDLKARMKAASQKAEKSAESLVSQAAASRVQIQLAADPDEIAMRLQWERVLKANRDVLRDKALAIQTTQSGGTTFYRLRVGPFRDAAEAKGVCQALRARGQDCIVAKNG